MSRLPLCAAAVWRALVCHVACAALGLALAACEPETRTLHATQVVVMVRSDFGAELVSVDAEIYDEAEQVLGSNHHFVIDAGRTLPFSFTVIPPRASTRSRFLVVVRGTDVAAETVVSKSLVEFIAQETQQIEIWLRKGCLGRSCASGQTCRVEAEVSGCGASPVVRGEVSGSEPVAGVDGGPAPADEAGALEAGAALADAMSRAGDAMSLPDVGAAASSDASTDAGPRDSGGGQAAADSGSDAASADAGFGPNGDPSAPLIALSEVACRSMLKQEFGANATIGGRALMLDYPCGKHEGAQLSLIVNLHGTISNADQKYYVRDYFSAYRHLSTHNLIIATPASVASQWGNGDNGSDRPYLLALVDWIYQKFDKAKIRSLWIAGHSWGAYFGVTTPSALACDNALMSRVRGGISMSAGLPNAPCLARLSLISTNIGTETPVDLTGLATQHGCAVPATGMESLGENQRRYFTGCADGYVHESYVMNGKVLTDFIDPPVVQRMVEAIKAGER